MDVAARFCWALLIVTTAALYAETRAWYERPVMCAHAWASDTLYGRYGFCPDATSGRTT